MTPSQQTALQALIRAASVALLHLPHNEAGRIVAEQLKDAIEQAERVRG